MDCYSKAKSNATPALQMLLNRLENVHRHGAGWRANCPAHQSMSRSSLSIAQGEDGRVLLHCFGGCEVGEILQVCGLELADLFPERITHHATAEQRKMLQRQARLTRWGAALSELQLEARVVLIAARRIRDGKPLNDTDQARLNRAVDLVEQARRTLSEP